MKYTYKQIWLITYPVMMSVLMEQLINITDAIFLGHVGETELGASAIAGIYYLAMYMLGFGFSLGLQVLIARRNGEQKYPETGKTFFQGLYFLILLAVILITLSKLLSPYIMQKLITSPEVYNAVMDYTVWRSFGLLFAFPALAFRAFLVGSIKTKILTVNALVMVFTNIILNYCLIFGCAGFPALGISGAAIASTLSEMVSLIIFILYLVFRMQKKQYGLTPCFDAGILFQLFRLSSWSMLQAFTGVAPWFLFFIAIEQLGKNQLAIANMIRSISTLFFVIVSSLATTTASLVSNLIGAGKDSEIFPLCMKIIRLGYYTGFPLIILAFIFRDQILGIYTSNGLLIKDAFWPFVLMLSNYLFAVPSYIYCNAVTGTGRTKTTFTFQLITIIFYLGYLYLISNYSMASLPVYWLAEHLYVIILLGLSYIYLKKCGWQKEL